MVLLGGKLVDIQHGFPFRVWPAKFIERRSPPEAARIIRILPEIVEQPAAPGDVGDIVRPVVNRRQRVAIGGKSGVAESFQRPLALLLDEIQRAFALDFFQPQIRIVVGSGDGRPVVDGHGSNSTGAGRAFRTPRNINGSF